MGASIDLPSRRHLSRNSPSPSDHSVAWNPSRTTREKKKSWP
ncbi:MAG TPA: hypothetical protein PKK92_09345 [Methanothrix sp.]|nr:hypothetical protein [Methanothrix sp.]